eukprot:Gb_25407 [translate_table: standard]
MSGSSKRSKGNMEQEISVREVLEEYLRPIHRVLQRVYWALFDVADAIRQLSTNQGRIIQQNMERDDIERVENPPLKQGEMPLRRKRRREAEGPLDFEREANQDQNNLNQPWQEEGIIGLGGTQYKKPKLEIPRFTDRIVDFVQRWMRINRRIRIVEVMLDLRVPQSQNSRLETPKFVRKDEGMDVLIKIHEIRQHFKQNFMGKDEPISVSLINQPCSSQSTDKKKSEGENFWETSRSSKRGNYEKEGESGTSVPLPSDATKQANLSIPRSNGVLPKPASSIGQVSEPASTKHTIDALDKKRNEDQIASQRARDNMEPPVQGRRNFHSSGLPVPIAQEHTVSGGGSWRGFLKAKTLWIDDHKSVNCDDGQSVLTLDTMAFDPRGINYDSLFVLNVGTMVIDTRVCDLRVPTLGTMVFSTIATDSSIPDLDMYRYLGEEGQKIKEKLIGPEFLDLKSGEIRVIISIPKQCQAGFMLEDAGIYDDRGMIMSACGGTGERNTLWNWNQFTLDQFEASNVAESSKVKAQKLFSELKRVVEKCPVGDMGCLNGLPLEKIHLESGLGDAIVGGGIENKLVQPQFSISLKSVAKHDEQRVENLTMSTLKMLADEGVEVLQHNLFKNNVFYTEIAFDMHSLRPDLLPLVPLFCQSLLHDQFVVNPLVKQVEEPKFDLLITSTADAILLIVDYSDFLIEELLLQAVDIRQVSGSGSRQKFAVRTRCWRRLSQQEGANLFWLLTVRWDLDEIKGIKQRHQQSLDFPALSSFNLFRVRKSSSAEEVTIQAGWIPEVNSDCGGSQVTTLQSLLSYLGRDPLG